MDSLTFTSKLVEFLAWPAALALSSFFLRDKIKELLPLISKVKAGPFEMELLQLKKDVEVAKETATAAINALDEKDPPLPRADPATTIGSAPSDTQIGETSGDLDVVGEGGQTGDSPVARLSILRALDESKFAMRSLTGIAADTRIHVTSVRAILKLLKEIGLVSETINSTGAVRYFLTNAGVGALRTRASMPHSRPGKIGET
jgi:hypothetical protein